MGHDHDHPGHDHPHSHDADGSATPHFLDLTVPDSELAPRELSRRAVLRRLGILGAAIGSASVLGGVRLDQASASTRGRVRPGVAIDNSGRYTYISGDHHIHTQYSVDALFKPGQQAARSAQYGLGWMVITDHGRVAHEKVSVDRTNVDIVAAREALPNLLIFQGLEWNIPGGEHGTVFFTPSADEVEILRQFEFNYDGVVVFGSAASKNAAAQERLALDGIDYLTLVSSSGAQKPTSSGASRSVRTADALFLANHPARRGLDSPHEFRGWRDQDPGIAIGMEGAPGHQAAGLPGRNRPTDGRGFYDNSPSADSFAGYPPESYKTFGGFDYYTARVGGLWDSLLAEGKSWWITANSDAHMVYRDSLVRPNKPGTTTQYAGGDYDNPTSEAYGRYPDPVDSGTPQTGNGDFFPGFYSRTWVGTPAGTPASYADLMAGMRAGRIWVGHGGLIGALDVRVHRAGTPASSGQAFGGRLTVPAGSDVAVTVSVKLANEINNNGDLPKLARVDLIGGLVTGPIDKADAGARDTLTTPATRVSKTFDVPSSAAAGSTVTFTQTFRAVQDAFYVRVRGTDGKRADGGAFFPRDPLGPKMDELGAADPWQDLWFYSNPIFVDLSVTTQ